MYKVMNTDHLSENAQLAMDTILRKPTKGIPSSGICFMDKIVIERLAGAEQGAYEKNPEQTYCASQRNIGLCMMDQHIPWHPLKFEDSNFTEGIKSTEIVCDGVVIDSPEAVIDHMERFDFPDFKQQIADFDPEKRRKEMLDYENGCKAALEPEILNCAGGHFDVRFPLFNYDKYGYENYFMAYALYPEMLEKYFSLAADLYTLNNEALAPLFEQGVFPPYLRVGQDMADSRGMLMSIESIDKLWFPHYLRCMEPIIKTGIKLLWHCDGNLNDMLPRLLDIGFSGFQGFQYEDDMDYEKICKMKPKDGGDLIIVGGVSVTTTMPNGTPDDVRKEMKWLVDNGPKTGLFLSASSSVCPGIPRKNLEAFVEGLKYYREHGRG